ncbi:hypothetical protein [Pseudomonas chlororaphis]|uniref:DUF3137 domain-containing protein n=1 Tax=Pseudomonas chlororaphis TaxID=587753 RepID=A0A0D5Y3H7_9PSED|nr:hypothetical protein [Pseudomonas chlororaphis]AKA25539.1 hypothetical protein PCL1606_40900 [Pseudomonas chlororaphis]
MAGAREANALPALFDDVDRLVDAAVSPRDLLKAVERIRDFPGPLVLSRFDPNSKKLAWFLCIAGILIWPLLIPGIYLMQRRGATHFIHPDVVQGLSRKIIHKAALLNTGLSDGTALAMLTLAVLMDEFAHYRRGNYSQELKSSLSGVYRGAVHDLPYAFHHLHYVDKETYEVSVSDGKGGSRRETRTRFVGYDRYSLVFEFPWTAEVSVRGDRHRAMDREHSYKTTTREFNSTFTLTGATEMACATFATPVTVLKLLQIARELKDVSFEFSPRNRLCVSFSNDDVVGIETSAVSLAEPVAFHAALMRGVTMPRLKPVLELLHEFAELHDDNFNLPKNKTQQMEP